MLSPRELEILGYIAGGYTDEQIAVTLNIEASTVNSHRCTVYGKLNVVNAPQAIVAAVINRLPLRVPATFFQQIQDRKFIEIVP